jgi:hypothetical protein
MPAAILHAAIRAIFEISILAFSVLVLEYELPANFRRTIRIILPLESKGSFSIWEELLLRAGAQRFESGRIKYTHDVFNEMFSG